MRRRIISIPALFIAFAVFFALSPLLVVVGVIAGLIRRDRWALLRSIAMIGVYLLSEVGGMTIALGMWIASGGPFGRGGERRRRWFVTLQRWWTGSLWWGIEHCFSLELEVEEWPEDDRAIASC